ncbi:hypothetical protein YC2023_080447 [Brassica napus]
MGVVVPIPLLLSNDVKAFRGTILGAIGAANMHTILCHLQVTGKFKNSHGI